MKAPSKIDVKINLKGYKEAMTQIRTMKKEINSFYALGRKMGIKKEILAKWLSFQIERMDKPKVDLSNYPKVVYK